MRAIWRTIFGLRGLLATQGMDATIRQEPILGKSSQDSSTL